MTKRNMNTRDRDIGYHVVREKATMFLMSLARVIFKLDYTNRL